MKCSMCGYIFEKENAQQGCESCPMSGGCSFMKCPRCGFENVPEAGWLKKIRNVFGKKEKNEPDR